MADNWIFDVLADLRRFALANDLQALAAQVQATVQVAEQELAARADGKPAPRTGQGGRAFPH
ncbi:hypothetical protein GCM10011452_14410 [Gemmobacter lanyuensis]|uniref:Uncharacterized protein n=1 Tax=Gemmobacter lanyuensis TaxID=1054497 RepID=A0A918IRG9_9RHOB|nr:hypothetical protein [Gemmobacter lanyuensis]GGW27090.1 hypothetical protein GCM10011452_14410 [Gemmobacter lanyuensis]